MSDKISLLTRLYLVLLLCSFSGLSYSADSSYPQFACFDQIDCVTFADSSENADDDSDLLLSLTSVCVVIAHYQQYSVTSQQITRIHRESHSIRAPPANSIL